MDFSTGNSGNLLREAVIKIGPECQQEGAYAQLLGPEVCPEVYDIVPNGYVMEYLEPMPRYPSLLYEISCFLEAKIWSRPALPWSLDIDWKDCQKKYGVDVPDWVIPTEFCMVHGDPTTSNALRRYLTTKCQYSGLWDQKLVMCDPRPPRNYIPQCRETDLGRLMQSAMDWEVVAYGAEKVNFLEPNFRSSLERQRAIFWCGAAAARIEFLERSRDNRRHILDWCLNVRGLCNV
jgi:hypothetical protein